MPRLFVRPLEDRTVPVAGLLDPTFSDDGILKLDLPGFATSQVNGVAVQPDGKTLLAGNGDMSPSPPATLVRLTADGTPDPAFGGGDGVATIFFPGETATFYRVAVRPDGKIVACGTVGFGDYRVLVARFLPDGTPDPNFGGGDGVVTTNLSNGDENGFGLALQADGKIVVVGNTTGGFLFVRYTASGALDTTFNLDGVASFPASPVGRGVAVQPDGKIVGVGDGFAVIRLTATGDPDPTFSGDGIAQPAFPAVGRQDAYDVAVGPGGKIVAVGGVLLLASPIFGQHAFAQLLPDGTPDPSFDQDGYLVPDVPEVVGGNLRDVVVEADGQIVAAGEGARVGGDGYSTLFRYNPDGTPDVNFGVGNFRLAPGIVYTNSGGGEQFHGVALAPDGRIVAAGISDGRMSAVRYTGDPVEPVNAAPVAVDDAFVMPVSPFSVSAAAGVLANDTDADGDPLTAILVSPPAEGTLNLSADGSFTFSWPANFSGSTSFTYKVNDGTEDGTTATVTLTLAANLAPTAVPDSYDLPFATELVVPAAAGVLANDTDSEGDALTAALVAPPPVGTLTLNPNGSFTYSYPGELVGAVTFAYRVSDAGGPGTLGTVTLTRENLIDTRFGILTVLGSDRAESIRLLPSGSKVIVEVQTADGVTRTTATPTAPASSFSQTVVYLGSGDDRLDSTALNRPVRADGGPGADTVRTGAGNDVLFGGIGDDLIAAGNGRNEVYGGEGDNRITTGTGADTIVAGGGNNQIDAGAGTNAVTLGDGSNVVTTGSGNDTVTAGDGRNDLSTGAGADRVTAGNGGNVVDAGSGNDVVVSGGGADRLFGGSGNDVVEGRGGNDVIDGGLGNDLLAAGVGADLVEGGAGHDILFDGDVTPSRPADTLSKLLAMYDPGRRSTLVTLTNRFTVVPDNATDTLTGGSGTDWFWTTGPDDLDRLATEAMNAVT
jgi:uncharacterized delta-60 repeat protein